MRIKLKETLAPLFKKGDILDVTDVVIESYKIGNVNISKDLVEVIPKRKPDKDGTLNLTQEEKIELCQLVTDSVGMVRLSCNGISYRSGNHWYTIYEIRAILWIAERFDLIGGN
jgi:hypothetical protein